MGDDGFDPNLAGLEPMDPGGGLGAGFEPADPSGGGIDLGPLLPSSGVDQMFQLMQGIFLLIFVLVIGLIIFRVVRSSATFLKNEAAPEVAATATIINKRIELSGGGTTSSPGMMAADGSFGPSVTTSNPIQQTHYVTFQQSGGERFELKVPAADYGLLVVGDQGTVSMKGTRFLGFARELLR